METLINETIHSIRESLDVLRVAIGTVENIKIETTDEDARCRATACLVLLNAVFDELEDTKTEIESFNG